jgi:hypothetical protein
MFSVAFAFCSIAATLCQGAEPEAVPLVAGKAFLHALEQPFAAAWENIDLRQIARRITATRGIPLLVDRRLDPSRGLSITATGEPLESFLERLAEAAGGRLSVAGNTVYLGPADAARKLRTLVYLRQQELTALNDTIPRSRRSLLSQPAPFSWEDLSQPAELVSRLAAQRQLKVDGLEQVPYDLWGGVSLSQVTGVEALSLVLIQFDLTFEWLERGERIRLVPIPEQVGFERKYSPGKGQTAAAALAQWREQLPELEARIAGGEIHVRGTLEQHEALDGVRRNGTVEPKAPKPLRAIPLKQERYTLRIMNKPVRALLKTLSEPANGPLTFEYDADLLKKAGIDLDQRVTFEVRNATIEQLLKAALDPLKLTFEINDRTVRLTPAKE